MEICDEDLLQHVHIADEQHGSPHEVDPHHWPIALAPLAKRLCHAQTFDLMGVSHVGQWGWALYPEVLPHGVGHGAIAGGER